MRDASGNFAAGGIQALGITDFTAASSTAPVKAVAAANASLKYREPHIGSIDPRHFAGGMMPGVAFDLSDPVNVKPMLTHIRRIAAVVTYGRPRWMAWYMGDPPRRIVTRYLRRLTGE